MPVFKIHHVTKYVYDRPIKDSINEIKIFPYKESTQEILQQDLTITDHPELHVYQDYWDNKVAVFSLVQPHQELVIDSRLVIRTTGSPTLQVNYHSTWEELEEEKNQDMRLQELAMSIKYEPTAIQILSMKDTQRSVAQFVSDISEFIFKHFKYSKGITNVETTVEDIWSLRQGVCQDFALVMLEMLRAGGVPAKYVSGYICPNKNGMRGEGATHAWVEAWIPKYGWAGIDPTNNIWITNNHVKLSAGAHFEDCTPIKGVFKGPAKQDLYVYVSVGYEDGHVFEDTNHARLSKQTPVQDQEEDLRDIFSAEHQQQQ